MCAFISDKKLFIAFIFRRNTHTHTHTHIYIYIYINKSFENFLKRNCSNTGM